MNDLFKVRLSFEIIQPRVHNSAYCFPNSSAGFEYMYMLKPQQNISEQFTHGYTENRN